MDILKKSLIPAVIIVVAVGGWYIFAKMQPSVDKDTSTPIIFSCAGGNYINAVFHAGKPIAGKEGEVPTPTGLVDVKLSDGREMTLPQTLSADGARFANADESFVFWGKGNGVSVEDKSGTTNYTGCIAVMSEPVGSGLSYSYSSPTGEISIRLGAGYTIGEGYLYQITPKLAVTGVKFTIPADYAKGTNLSADSYISVEGIPDSTSCSADMFLDGTHSTETKEEYGRTYSVAHDENVGAGNRYEETVYAIPHTNPCIAVRYVVHSTVLENYPEGTVTAFDKTALVSQFDAIRSTLIINI